MTCRNLRQPRQAEILIVGVGNADRGDDGVGLAVASALSDEQLDGVHIHLVNGDCLPLLAFWQQVELVIIIDAVQSGAKPGTIYRLDASHQPLPQSMIGSSSHSFGLGQTVELGRTLQQLPRHLIIYGVEGYRFEVGGTLSVEVAQALPEVTSRIRFEMKGWRGKCTNTRRQS